MGLKLKELQRVVKNVIKEEKNSQLLRAEVVKALGPTILTSQGLVRMAESANERIDILEAMNRTYGQVRPSLLLKFVDSDSTEVRKLVARLLPESFLKLMITDSNPAVRAAVARRLPISAVNEMVRRFPNDDTLRAIERSKKLAEAGLPTPEISDEEFDMYGEMPLSDATDDTQHPGLTDTWYNTLALKIVNMYGRNIEEQWEEDTVHRYVDSMKSMGVDVDRDKLMEKVYDLLEQRDERVMAEGSLKSLAQRLRNEEMVVMPMLSESVDPVKELISSGYTTVEYIQKFEESFSVKYVTSKNPAYLTLAEGAEKVSHPASAELPGSMSRNVDERAVDAYVTAWNTRESIRGAAPYRLNWSRDPEVINMVNFHLELK